MKILKFLLFTIIVFNSSCDYRTGKYLRATENWDGPRCKTFEYRDFEAVELAKCIETNIYLLSYNKRHPEIAQYLDEEAIAVYIRREENINIFNNTQFIFKTFKEATIKGKIYEVGINDSIMELITFNDQLERTTYTYKLK